MARYEKLMGKQYIVAPMTLLGPKIVRLEGERPRKLLASEITFHENVRRFNNIPILLHHCELGEGRDPAILNKQCMGYVFNAKGVAGKLLADGYFSVSDTERLAPGLVEIIANGVPIETSVGFHSTSRPEGEFDIVQNFIPDHVAVVLGMEGIFNIAGGFGVNAK